MGICVSCRRRDLQAPEKRAGGAGGGRVPGKGATAELLPRRADPAMANSISNIKMSNPIKGIVSKRRKRYIKDGFNLDLAYITDRLIAMGFPAEKLEGVYRNHIDEVYRFLEQMHKDHYKIYNLCSERCYDSSKFHGRVERYAFEDHTPPKMELIQPFCEDVHNWLSLDPRNVAAVHCKAGKGRTGTMVCCYLLYSGQKATADEALKFYGTKRTHDEKGVTIPSQRRYVEYYAALVRSGLQYRAPRLHIRELLMWPPPHNNGTSHTLELAVSQAEPPLKAPAGSHEVRRHESHIRVVLDQCTPLHGDVRVDVYNKPKMMMRKEKLFHFWFNTFFVANCVGAVRIPPPADSMNLETYKLTLNKWQLDDAHKDKQHKLYSPDFKVELVVQKQPDSSRFSACARAPASPPSSPSSDDDHDSHWDSGEHYPLPAARMDVDHVFQPFQADLPDLPDLPDSRNKKCKHRVPLDGPGIFTRDGYMLIDRSRPQKDFLRLSDPQGHKCDAEVGKCTRLSDPTGSRKGKHMGTVTKDGYMLVDATPRQPHLRPAEHKIMNEATGLLASNVVSNAEDDYMEFSATDGQMKPVEVESKMSTFNEDYYLCSEVMSSARSDPCDVKSGQLNDIDSKSSDDSSEAIQLDSNSSQAKTDKSGKNKKHSFFKRDDYKNDKGKIPKVSSDHTISDDSKKKYTFFQKRDDEGTKPRLSLGDMRASWREFSGKWSENRKKKDREDS